MKNYLLILFFFSFCFMCNSQNYISKIIVDKETRKAIQGVTISNSRDYTVTNSDGHFTFNSSKDSLTIKMLGYNDIKTTFYNLKNSLDTIYLKTSPIELKEIIIGDYKKIIFDTYAQIQKNYPHMTFSELFFLRSILKKNDSIIKIEDISGRIKRNSIFTSKQIPKLKFDFQLLNQRKLGILDKNEKVEDFRMQTLDELFTWFSTIFINPHYFHLTREKLPDNNYLKIKFNPLSKYLNKNAGYYILNKKDNSIKKYYSITNPIFKKKIPFTHKRGFKWRTVESELTIQYEKDSKKGLYFISNASLNQVIELFNRENKKNIYEVSYELIITKPFQDLALFNKNVSGNKELFKLDTAFDPKFWANQNQLPLSDELKAFIMNVSKYKKQYRVISNF